MCTLKFKRPVLNFPEKRTSALHRQLPIAGLHQLVSILKELLAFYYYDFVVVVVMILFVFVFPPTPGLLRYN